MASSDANLNPSVDDETANQGETIIVKIASFSTPTNQFSSTSLNFDFYGQKIRVLVLKQPTCQEILI